jgi:A/G-specific adenine glycosylase
LPFDNRKSSIVKQVLRWYSRSARALPWRGETRPYRILISEIMLQQTQVSRVLQVYPRFLKRFPNLATLARARTSSVIRMWKGMGYNNRAVRLQNAARIVLDEYNGKLPTTIEDLQLLPGVGKYTAHALACLAFNQHVPVVDTNINRVLGRIFPAEARKTDIWKLADMALPKRNASHWNQALMDLGATVCTAVNPKCGTCPVAKLCPSSFRIRRSNKSRTRREPSRDGLPNRIYRGRVVDVLRHSRGKSFVPLRQLGRQIKESYSRLDEDWLVQLMEGLEKDGLVVLKKMKLGLAASLPQ